MALTYVDDTIGHVFTPPTYNPGADAFGLSSPAQYTPYQGPSGNNSRFSILKTDTDDEGNKIIYWRLEVYDLRQGFKQTGRWENDFGAVASSTLTTYFDEQGCLPFLTTADSSVSISTPFWFHSTNVFGTLAMAVDNGTATSYFFKETSTTNPALTRITYAPGARISALQRLVFGSTEYCMTGYLGANASLLSNLTTAGPTVAYTMDATSSGMLGAVQTFLPNNPILFHTQNGLKSLDSTLTPTTALTPVLTNFPISGYPLGLASLGGSPVRVFFLVNDNGSGQFIPGSFNGSNFNGVIISTDQSGTTPQKLTMPIYRIQHASLYRDGIIATDETRVIFHNGRYIRDLKIFKDVSPNSNKIYKCVGLFVDGPQLFAEINIIASPSGSGNTTRAIWYYDFDQDSWFQISATTALSTTGVLSLPGVLGVSQSTGFLHMRSDNTWYRMFHAPYAANPFSYRKTSGAAASTGQEYEASGAVTTCACELPGLEGMPKLIRSVQFMGDVDAGGTGGTPAKVNVTAPGVDTSSHTLGDFQTGNSGKLQRRDFEDNTTSFYKFQPTITVTRQSGGTDPTRFTPQFLPIAFEGVAYYRPWLAPASREEVNT